MAAGQSGQTGLPAVRSAGREEELRLELGPAVIPRLPLVGQTVPESILMFSRATIFHVSDQSYLDCVDFTLIFSIFFILKRNFWNSRILDRSRS